MIASDIGLSFTCSLYGYVYIQAVFFMYGKREKREKKNSITGFISTSRMRLLLFCYIHILVTISVLFCLLSLTTLFKARHYYVL